MMMRVSVPDSSRQEDPANLHTWRIRIGQAGNPSAVPHDEQTRRKLRG